MANQISKQHQGHPAPPHPPTHNVGSQVGQGRGARGVGLAGEAGARQHWRKARGRGRVRRRRARASQPAAQPHALARRPLLISFSLASGVAGKF